jgi:hypothetical protein
MKSGGVSPMGGEIVKYTRALIGAAAGCASLLCTLAPASAWDAKLEFNGKKSMPAAIGSPTGKMIKIKPPARTVSVKECNHDVFPACRIDFKGQELWISYGSLKDTDYTFLEKTPLRDHPSDKAAATATMPKHSVVVVQTCNGDFCKVSWEGKPGWVSMDDLWNIGEDDDF